MNNTPYEPGEPKRGTWAWWHWRVAELERLNAHYRETLETVSRARGGTTPFSPETLKAIEDYRTKAADPRGDTVFTPRTAITEPKVLEWRDDSIHAIPDNSTRFHRFLGLLICLGVVILFWWGIYCIYELSRGSYATYIHGVGKK